MTRLDGASAIVTGAAQGIGATYAKRWPPRAPG
jgi:short-subunit dehydrogenase